SSLREESVGHAMLAVLGVAVGGGPFSAAAHGAAGDARAPKAPPPRSGAENRPAGQSPAAEYKLLTKRFGKVDPTSLEAYRKSRGYAALARAIEIGPADVIAEVTTSKLLGRGGAAFPTGRKWDAVSKQAERPHYLVCNADESEPGTFKDRILMEEDPFALVEAMTIAGYATGCERGFLYVRAEYPLAHERLENALMHARSYGLLGDDVMGAGFA